MDKLYMGIDVGAVMVKGVILDECNNIITSSYTYTYDNPVNATKKIINKMRNDIDLSKYKVVSFGVTGSARKLIGTFLNAPIIKNEITSSTKGVVMMYPDTKTILEIGGQNSKIITVSDGNIVRYDMNTSCSSGIGMLLDMISKKINIDIDDISKYAKNGEYLNDISTGCNVYLLDDVTKKIQEGYKIEDILLGVCKGICKNYVNNVISEMKIKTPIVFIGGVSKNSVIASNLSEMINEKIIVPNNANLMGAIGIATLVKESGIEREFNFDIDKYVLETKVMECDKCSCKCSLVMVYKNNILIDHWGNRCENI